MKRWMWVLFIAATLPAAVFAQSYPSKSIRWIVPYPPGGSFDGFSRVVAAQLSSKYPPAEPGALVCEPLEAARSGR